ncbi:ABC transporter ATP-binding protein [Lagierella sp.]|uniref:ABC transporter ATP-binding protein n=1 Tax=Lagierella sp. TaxID=2849657 RepID=UPI00261585EA|nr:ABC transporter ATP-binding protein [Lagierella sp.]
MFKEFRWFINSYKRNLLFGITFLLLSDIAGIFPPYLIGELTDRIFENTINLDSFIKFVALLAGIVILKYFLAMGWSFFIHRGGNEIELRLRDMLMSKFLDQSMEFFEENSTGSLMGKSTNDITAVSDMIGFGTLAMFDATVYPLFIVIVMIISVSWKLTLATIIPIPLLAILVKILGDKIYNKFEKAQQAFDKLNSFVLEDVVGIRIINVFNLQRVRRQMFGEKGQELKDKNLEVAKYRAFFRPIDLTITAISFSIAIFYGAVLINRGEISIGKLVSFTFYLNMLIWPMFALGNFINIKNQATASMHRIQEVLDYEEEIVDKVDAIDKIENPSISFRNFSFKYPDSDYILKDINLEIPYGTSLGVLGKTGSGKSTLLKQLLKYYDGDFSSIIINGRPLDDYTTRAIRETTGNVPQKHMIFSKTIKENIMLSNPNATEEELNKAIEMADFKKDIKDFPLGLDTLCGERGVSLSGGQKQRIGIARAFLKDPEILILDDAMSAVDGKTERNIINNINGRKNKGTLILACHRISQVMNLDHIIVLEDGKIIEEGSHAKLMELDGWYATQFVRQMAGGRYSEE